MAPGRQAGVGPLARTRPIRLTARERQVVERHRTPRQVQRFLDSFPYNFQKRGRTLRSFRSALRAGEAHCLEAALMAAAILERHGHPPLLLDLESVDLLDHGLLLYRGDTGWGSVGRSRDPGLHGRKPVFRSVRALVQSYVLPYIDHSGRIVGYGVYDLRTLKRCDWRFSKRNVWAVERALIENDHRPLPTSDRVYRRWHRRYLAFRARHPNDKPLYYPGRHTWLSAGPGKG